MLFFLLPVVALLLSRETAVSANNNDKWLSTVAQYDKERSWNRFRDVSFRRTASSHRGTSFWLDLYLCALERVQPRTHIYWTVVTLGLNCILI
uniref:Uncharacterized protein n=1 Tax=Myripristis murdjan TaxID=586833 RepID=A0A667X6E4_9TELE